jgi:hypothetical protein
MSFLDSYLDKHRLDKLPDKTRDNLTKLEDVLEDRVDIVGSDFEECLQKFGPVIADLIERVAEGTKNADVSLATARWVINIAIEVYQVVDQMADCVIDDEMTPEEAHEAKVEFGKDLTYFVWMTIDPLAKYLSWLPFRKRIEKALVRWLAGYGLEATVDLLAANDSVRPFGAPGKITVTLKAVP